MTLDWEGVEAHARFILVRYCSKKGHSLDDMLKKRAKLHTLLEDLSAYPQAESIIEVVHIEIDRMVPDYYSPLLTKAYRSKKKGDMEGFRDALSEAIAFIETYPHLMDDAEYELRKNMEWFVES